MYVTCTFVRDHGLVYTILSVRVVIPHKPLLQHVDDGQYLLKAVVTILSTGGQCVIVHKMEIAGYLFKAVT